MPKIWKGCRKRKKQKTGSVSTAPVSQPLQSIQENSTNNNNNGAQATADDDIFKLLDDAFLPGTNKEPLNKENEMAVDNVASNKQPTHAAAEKLDLNRKSTSVDKPEILSGQKELEFIPDDEVCCKYLNLN